MFSSSETSEQKLLHLIPSKVAINQVRIGNYNINYVEAGAGPPLLLIHGANIGWGAWYPNIAELAKHFSVCAVDLPGSGNSTKVDFQKINFEDDFVSVVEEFIRLKNLHGAHVIGHSLGGWIALKLHLKKVPFGKIVLQSSLGFSDYVPWSYRLLGFRPFAHLLSEIVMRPTKENMRKFLAGVMINSDFLQNEFIEYFYDSVVRDKITHPFMLINRLCGVRKIREELVLTKDLSKISIPILIIAGAKDPLIPLGKISRVARSIRNGRFEVFPKTGHVPSLEKSPEFNALTINFLKS